jgi:Tfp pilus assembly protein PilV
MGRKRGLIQSMKERTRNTVRSPATTPTHPPTHPPTHLPTYRPTRGFTLVELTLVALLTSLVVGAVAGLYVFSAQRTAHAVADETILGQTTTVLQQLEKTISQANTCSAVAVGTGTALKCIMPANGTDHNGDGYMDSFTPVSASRRCTEHWGQGQRVWFYMSDSTGNPTASGTYVWRAKRNDDTTPTSSDADPTWTFYYGGNARTPLITGFSFTVNSSAQTVAITLTANELARAQRSSSASSDSSQSRSMTVTRTIYWRNWRQ